MAYFLIGGCACCISHASVCPFDVVKTRQQGNADKYRDINTGEAMGMIQVCLLIIRTEGFLTLFIGLEATAAGYFVQGCFKYGLWNIFKVWFGYATISSPGLRFLALASSACLAELFASTLLCPYERARIRLVAEPTFASSALKAILLLQEEQGFLGGLFGHGGCALWPTLLKMCTYTTAQLTTFQVLTDWAFSLESARNVQRLWITFPSAVMAAVVASILSQPGDALQTQASKKATAGEDIPPMWAQAKALGCEGLWAGWRTRIVMFSVMIVIQLMVYDNMRVALGA